MNPTNDGDLRAKLREVLGRYLFWSTTTEAMVTDLRQAMEDMVYKRWTQEAPNA